MTEQHGTSPAASALGRYLDPADGAEEHDTPDDEPLVEVRLLRFPLRLFEQAREHHDEVMREFALLALATSAGRVAPAADVPVRLIQLIEILGTQYGAARDRSDALRDAALERGDPVVDLYYLMPPSAAAPIRALHELMQEADDFCRSEQLLTMPSSELVVRFRSWFLDQFQQQLQGQPPTPWDGPVTDAT